jgi:ribosomal protein L10
MHVHVTCSEGEAKFWLEPTVALADHQGLRPRQLAHIEREIKERSHEIIAAWAEHFR